MQYGIYLYQRIADIIEHEDGIIHNSYNKFQLNITIVLLRVVVIEEFCTVIF